MKKSKLVIEYEYNFDLIGIATAARGYKLAWELNQRLHVSLVKQPDHVVGFKNEEEKPFSYYAYETPLNRLKLFKNKADDPELGKYYLIPEFPHFDFIILAAMDDYPRQELIDLLRSIPSIQLASFIPLDGLKSKSNFIF